MAGEVDFDTLRQEPFTTTLAAALQDGTARLGFHAGAEAELLLARALGRLISAFHRNKKSVEPVSISSGERLSTGNCLVFRSPLPCPKEEIPENLPFVELVPGERRLIMSVE